jgi:pSer/pThr/pTyr-binding forkhead associated (FHA) protein
MEFEIGIACGQCDTFNPMGTTVCSVCGRALLLGNDEKDSDATLAVAENNEPHREPRLPPALDFPQLPEEKLMEHARNYICRECSMAVPSGHKFCGTCGAAVPPEIVELQTKYFGTLQEPGKARLILVRGDSEVDGLSYVLQGTEHIAGREEGQILFPEDIWLSPRHANFLYQGGKLVVMDENSVNGVFLRVSEPTNLNYSDQFLCGEHLFRLEPPPDVGAEVGPDQTHFYASPRKPTRFRVTEILKGGAPGAVFCISGNSAQIGREECEISYPKDIYMSGTHAKIEITPDGSFRLIDSGSRNGTYVRIKRPQPLRHGDYLFLGKQLLRIEMTA